MALLRFAWKVQNKYKWRMIKKKKSRTKKWGIFEIVGIYSSGVKMTLKVWFTPMETSYLKGIFAVRME